MPDHRDGLNLRQHGANHHQGGGYTRREHVQPETKRNKAGAETRQARDEAAGEGAGKHDECGLQ